MKRGIPLFRRGRIALCVLAMSAVAFAPSTCPAKARSSSDVSQSDATGPTENLFLSDYGTHVVAFSSEFGSGWEASNLTPSRADIDPDGSIIRPLIWSSASMAPFPHWLLFAFDKPRWVTTLVFDNYLEEEADHPGISAKDMEIWAGDDPDTLQKIKTLTLERNRSGQKVEIAPIQARYIKLVIRTNYGHPWYTELNATGAFDNGTRPDVAAQ